jgi:transcriptional regulator with XRE-family HTH domain
MSTMGGAIKKSSSQEEIDRDVIRCQLCGLVQYRTRTGFCRRCLRLLPPILAVALPAPEPPLEEAQEQQGASWPNLQTVERIGDRVRQLREWRGMTQSQLQSQSKVSRSYLSRIESGQMTPSLGTLEKISEALGVGLSRFFVPESQGELVLEDPFIQNVRPFLRQLDVMQWQSILKRLQAITDHVGNHAGPTGFSHALGDRMVQMPSSSRHSSGSVSMRAHASRV